MTLKKEKKKWENSLLKKSLKSFPECKDKFVNLSGTEIKRLYTPEDAKINYSKDLGFPGDFPFTRGVQPTMYRARPWTMRQFSGFGSAEDTNKRYKYLLKHGQTGLSVAFDLPTLLGYDSDNDITLGEVGKEGVAIDSLKDMETLFKGIPLDKISTSMTINGPAAIIWAFYIAAAENQGVKRHQLRGTIQNDILKEYSAQKTWIFPPAPSIRLIVDTIEFGSTDVQKWNTISISGYHIREAGATAVQELAFTLADGLAYVDAALKRGLKIDHFAPRLSYFFNSHNNFFEEVAKYRAARRIWAKEMKKRGAKKPESMKLRFHTQTAGCSLTAQQPEINIVRVTLQALAAVLGGTQSLHTNSMDEALALPSEEAVKIALRTQQIIASESGVTDTIDPLAGSYYVEALTNKMEEETQKYFKLIKKFGGMVNAVESGFIQDEIGGSAYEYQKDVDDGDIKIVGVNCFEDVKPLKIDILKISNKIRNDQVKKIKKLKMERNNKAVLKILNEIEAAALGKENLMPYFIKAAHAYATLGEITETLIKVFGEYKENLVY